MKHVLLDLNVVLGLFLKRAPWVVEATAIWQANDRRLIQGCISTASLPTLFYIVERQADHNAALAAIDACLQSLHVLPVDRSVVSRARALAGPDFEDDLQIATALESQLEGIVTRDPAGFSHSPVAVYSPADLLRDLESLQGPTP